jgi:hypothetical protein
MIYQTDSEFEPDINKYGCYFLSLMWQMNRFLRVPPMEHKIIEVIYNNCKHVDANNNGVNDMDTECFISDPQGLVDYVAKDKVLFIGKKTKNYTCAKGQFAIQSWYNPNTKFTHFVAEGDDGKVGYDPIRGGSKTVREGAIESKRIYQLRV